MALRPGSLKIIVASPGGSRIDVNIARSIDERISEDDVRAVSDCALLVYTDAEPSLLRDRLARQLEEGESILVAEFERWSGYGPAVDAEWLLRRGH